MSVITETKVQTAATTVSASGTLGSFIAAVKAAGAGIGSRVPVPVLAGALIETTYHGDVIVSRYDYETATRAVVKDAEGVGGEARVLVNHKMLLDMLTGAGKRATKRVSDAWPVTISQENSKVTVNVNGTGYTLATMPIDEYPALPEMWTDDFVTVDPATFIKRMDSALASASTDDTLPILTSIRMEFEPGNLSLLATDRYRLTMAELETKSVGKPHESVSFLLRAKTWKAVKRVIDPKGLPVALHYITDGNPYGRDYLTIRQGGVSVNSLAIDGDYPKIRSLFPDGTPIVFEMEADELASAVAAVAVTAERNTPVKLTYNGIDSLRVQAGTGEDAQAEAFLPYEGAEGNRGFAVCFNPGYLGAALKDMKGQRIAFCHTTAPKPALIRVAGNDVVTVKHLVMPVRLKD